MKLSERDVFMVESRYHQEKGERTTLAGRHSIRLVYKFSPGLGNPRHAAN